VTWDVDKVAVVVAVRVAVAAVGRVAWAVPKRPDRAATACAPVVVIRCLIRRDSHVTR
jgi:hypothetical protein